MKILGFSNPSRVANPLVANSDALSGATDMATRGWTLEKPAAVAVATMTGTEFRSEPVRGGNALTGSLWANTTTGYLYYKQITGYNVEMRAKIRTRNTADTSTPSTSGTTRRLASIMAHDPNRASLNYTGAGLGMVLTTLAAEARNTINNVTTPSDGLAWPVDETGQQQAEIRLVRRQSIWSFGIRPVTGGDWVSITGDVDRSANPMPETLWWGLSVSANMLAHDIIGFFRDISFQKLYP